LRTVAVVSSTPANDSERERTQDFPADDGYQPDRICELRQLRTTLARAIGSLPERYQKVVFLYYTNDLTMKERRPMMPTCPECESNLDFELDEVDEGDVIVCDECGSEYEVVAVDPLELSRVGDDLDDDDEALDEEEEEE